jgi:hypothetical protein
LNQIDSPNKVAETQHQDANTGELNCTSKVGLKIPDILGEHWRKGEGAEALCKCDLHDIESAQVA